MTLIIVLLCLGLIFCVAAIIGNSLVVTTIVRVRRLHTTSNIYICVLAAIDILISIMHNVKFIMKGLEITSQGGGCFIFFAISVVSYVVSLMVIQLITLDRFFAIYRPFWYRKYCSKSFAVKISLGTILLTIGIVSSVMALSQPTRKDYRCLSEALVIPTVAIFVSALTTFAILELTFIYGAMFYKALKHQMSSSTGFFGRNADMSIFDIKALRTCSVILSAFILMWLPQAICMCLVAFAEDPGQYRLAVDICFLLPTVGCVLNPVVYAVMSTDIRRGIKSLVKTKSTPDVPISTVHESSTHT